jgi:hypothetical protein
VLKKITRMAVPALAMIFSFSCSSKQPPHPEELMLEDYDVMVQMLNEVYPGKTLAQDIFGVDIMKTLLAAREKINPQMTELEFAALVNEALQSCKGKNMRINPQLFDADGKSNAARLAHDRIPVAAIRKTHEISERLAKQQLLPPKTVDLVYFDGAYYSRHDFTVNGASYKQGMKLVSVDGRAPLDIIAGHQGRLNSFDYQRKIFYGDAFGEGVAHNIYRLMPMPADGARKFVFQTAAGGNLEIAVADSSVVENKAPQAGFASVGKTVSYLESEKLLYVRIPAMNDDDLPFYDKEIRDVLKNREVAAVILDVRNNLGGGDQVWHKLLELFVENTTASFSLVTRHTPAAMGYMKRIIALNGVEVIRKSLPIFTPFLSLKEMQLYTLNVQSNFADGKVCPVYIITHDVRGTTGNLLSVAGRMPNVTSVGLRNPVQLGMGTADFFFSLPNSKLVISLALQLDLTGCKSVEDITHTQVNLEVPFTAEQFIAYLNRDNIGDLPDYLLKHDPFIQKILDARKPKVEEKPADLKPAEEKPAEAKAEAK